MGGYRAVVQNNLTDGYEFDGAVVDSVHQLVTGCADEHNEHDVDCQFSKSILMLAPGSRRWLKRMMGMLRRKAG